MIGLVQNVVLIRQGLPITSNAALESWSLSPFSLLVFVILEPKLFLAISHYADMVKM